MKFTIVQQETVASKYCKPGENIVHEYFLQRQDINGHIGAFRRSLFTHEHKCKDDFECDFFSSKNEVEKKIKEYRKAFPNEVFKIISLTDEDIFNRSTAALLKA